MDNSVIVKLKKKSKLMKNKDVRRIIDEQIEGYELSCYERENTVARLINPNDNSTIEIIIGTDNIYLVKENKNIYEMSVIKSNCYIEKTYCEKREKGIILKKINIEYGYTDYSLKDKYPITLTQKEYLIEKDKLTDSNNYDNTEVRRLFGEHLSYVDETTLETMSSFKTSFETHMKYYIPYDELENNKSLYSNYTYSNGKNISHLYDIVKGADMLSRIYDLYNGNINDGNIGDIRNIYLGLLSSDGFGYKEISGIVEKENTILGKSEYDNDEEKEKISKLISSVTWYKGKLTSLDRNSLIDAIEYQPTGAEIAKHHVEEVVGMSYQSFDNLDIEEQRNLIEKKTGKKIVYDDKLYSTVSMETIDDEIDKIVDKKKNILKKIKKNIIKR